MYPVHKLHFYQLVPWMLFCGLILTLTPVNAYFDGGETPTPTARPATSTPSPTTVPAIQVRELALIRQGPGDTFQSIERLRWSDEIELIERNKAGTWVKLEIQRGRITVEGWVMTGYLIFDETIHLSEIPVDETVPDADLSMVDSRTLLRLYDIPVISEVSEKMRQVYVLGQELGNHGNAITKIGDSLSASQSYLIPMSRGDHELGAYDFLDETINYYGASMSEISVASVIGLSSLAVFDPFWADKNYCQPNETPLDCEFRRKQPSVVFILFGPNDVRAMNNETYKAQMRQIVETSLENGVIPVLSTFSADPEEQFWWQSIGFNMILVDISQVYGIPLINLWSAARSLPQFGLDRDRIHLKHSGYQNIFFENGVDAYYGVALQNLLSIVMLDEIRKTLPMNE